MLVFGPCRYKHVSFTKYERRAQRRTCGLSLTADRLSTSQQTVAVASSLELKGSAPACRGEYPAPPCAARICLLFVFLHHRINPISQTRGHSPSASLLYQQRTTHLDKEHLEAPGVDQRRTLIKKFLNHTTVQKVSASS